MALIKTKLRNCLSVITLDALMMISSNGPRLDLYKSFDDYARAVGLLLDRALEHWRTKATRNVKRSHPGIAGRKKKSTDSVPLADLLEAQATKARREARRKLERIGPVLEEESESDEDLDEEDDDDDDDDDGGDQEAQEEETRAVVGPYTPPFGWNVQPPPASTQADWEGMNKPSFWKSNMKLAHFWESGWDTATFKRKYRGSNESSHGTYEFYYGSVKEVICHHIRLEDYGMTKRWVIIKRVSRVGARTGE